MEPSQGNEPADLRTAEGGEGTDPVAATLRGMRNWLQALTVLVVLLVGMMGALVWYAAQDYSPPDPEDAYYDDVSVDVGPNSALIGPIKDFVTGTYGADLASIEVRQVVITDDDSEEPPYRPYAVTYRLTGSDVTVTGLVEDLSRIAYYGFLPTEAPLHHQLTIAEFRSLQDAWRARTDKPMGYTYSDASAFTEYSSGDTLWYGGKEYLVDDLWTVSEGWVPPTADPVDIAALPVVRDTVFYYDRAAGKFVFLATEPSKMSVYPPYVAEGMGDYDY